MVNLIYFIMKKLLIALVVFAGMVSCTENRTAKESSTVDTTVVDSVDSVVTDSIL